MRDQSREPTQILGPGGGDGGAPATPEVGRPWGKFLIEKRLGSGGQAEVFQAFDQLGTAGHVALKVPAMPLPPDEVRRWLDLEAGSLVKLVHPNIVRVADAGCVGLYPYVATELVDGLPLNERIRTDPPSARRILDWTIALADALGSAHSRGVVHRDLKPLNVIITPEGHPLLIDFGLASLVTAYRPEPRRDASGSYPFMAPEQARGDEESDHRADVFGLGGILKYLLTGRGPYYGVENAMEAAQAGQVQPVEPSGLRGLRRRLGRIANRALDPDPTRRYANMREMAAALRLVRFTRSATLLGAATLALAAAAVGLLAAFGAFRPHTVRATMEVRLQRGDQVGSFQVLSADSLPLGPGDRIQVRATFSEALMPYLVVAGPESGAQLLYPAQGRAPQRTEDFQFPQGDQWYDLPAGGETRTILLLAGRRPVADVPSLVAALGPAPEIGSPSLLRLDSQGLELIPSTRAQLIGQSSGQERDGFLAAFAQQGPGPWAVVRAVAFPYWNEEQRAGRLAGYVRGRLGGRGREGGPAAGRLPLVFAYRLADYEPGPDTYMQVAYRFGQGREGGGRETWQGPKGYVEIGVPPPADKDKGIMSGEIQGLKIDVDPSGVQRVRLRVHSVAPAGDARYSALSYMVILNRTVVARGTSAAPGKEKTEEFELDPSLLRPGAQQIVLSPAGPEAASGAARFDWVELQLTQRG
jgi:hypothetical protein